MQTAPFHPVASNSPLKYMNGSKATYMKNLCFTAKTERTANKTISSLILEQYYLVPKQTCMLEIKYI